MKQSLKKFWHYEPFWKWYQGTVILIVTIGWIAWFILESRGIIETQTLEEFGLKLIN